MISFLSLNTAKVSVKSDCDLHTNGLHHCADGAAICKVSSVMGVGVGGLDTCFLHVLVIYKGQSYQITFMSPHGMDGPLAKSVSAEKYPVELHVRMRGCLINPSLSSE